RLPWPRSRSRTSVSSRRSRTSGSTATSCSRRGVLTSARSRTSSPVATLKERRNSAGRAGNDDHRPYLEDHVDGATRRRERILDLRGHGQELHRREEDGV